ncbi:uncharacterized protein LOC112590014 [Harpegnathos saltator]|uniref:uncharacterized protein LOC112590014 n=1 Tax=Harpegnathos saltator TaxID=610380 RepID=UPI000DBED910|nr:uncharacterized protein LOC112590014 [Harpegnathos saltator]
MRIILLVVFYAAAYAARIAAGGITATIPGNSVKYILKQKTRATGSQVPEVAVDDGMTQKTIKRSKQSLLVNRIDGFLQTGRVPTGKSTRVRRNPRRRTRRARNSNDEVARRRNDFEDNDDDTDADDVWSNMVASRGLPVWQVPESTTPTVARMDNPENSDSARSSRIHEATLPLAYSNPRGLLSETRTNEWRIGERQSRHESRTVSSPRKPVYVLSYPDTYADVIDRDPAFSRSRDSQSSIVEPGNTDRARSPLSGKPIERVLVPVYRLADAYSPKLSGPVPDPRGSPTSSHGVEKSQVDDNHPHASSFRKFLLVPVSKDLYILQDADEDSRRRAAVNGDNATSAVLAFKAHLHHDAKDVGKAYLRGRLLRNQHRLPEYHPDFDIFQEERRDPTPPSYPSFLYPGVSSWSYPDLIDAVSKVPDQQIVPEAADYRNILSTDGGLDVDVEIGSYSQPQFSSSSSTLDTFGYDVSLYSDDRQSDIFPATKSYETGRLGSNEDHGESSKYDEDVGLSTVDVLQFLNTLDDDVNTLGDAGKNVTDDDKGSLGEYATGAYSFGDLEEHTTSMSIFADAEERSSKKGQSEMESSRALLTAIEPLSSELHRLLNAVQLVNQSISDVQSRLCGKKNSVESTGSEENNEETRATNVAIDGASHHEAALLTKDLGRKSRRKESIESGSVASGEETDSTKLRKRSNSRSLFLNKLATPSRRHTSSFRT